MADTKQSNEPNNSICSVSIPNSSEHSRIAAAAPVLSVRSQTLRRQPGEISFPGGHCESTDKTGAAAAIRECSEE